MAKSIASPTSIGPEYEALVEILGAGLRVLDGDPRGAAVVRALVESRLLELLRRGDRAGVEGVLAEHTGERCTLAGLGVSVAGERPGGRPTLTPRAQHLREAELGLEQARARLDAVGEEAKRLPDLVAAAARPPRRGGVPRALSLAAGARADRAAARREARWCVRVRRRDRPFDFRTAMPKRRAEWNPTPQSP